MTETRQKESDEIFCRSCGEPIKERAEICPHCGVRNEKAESTAVSSSRSAAARESASASPSTTHDPSQYETTVSDAWWYGVAGGTVLWAVVFVLAGSMGDSLGALAGLLTLVAWVGLPVATYFDMQYVRANAEWNPNTVLWVVVMSVWLVNLVGGAVYLYRRHEVLGEP